MYDVPLHQSDNTFDPTVLEIISKSGKAGKEILSSIKDLRVDNRSAEYTGFKVLICSSTSNGTVAVREKNKYEPAIRELDEE